MKHGLLSKAVSISAPLAFEEALTNLNVANHQRFLASDGIFKLPEAEAAKNAPSSEVFFDPGNYVYGLAMFHQMHCLVGLCLDGTHESRGVCLLTHMVGTGHREEVILPVSGRTIS